MKEWRTVGSALHFLNEEVEDGGYKGKPYPSLFTFSMKRSPSSTPFIEKMKNEGVRVISTGPRRPDPQVIVKDQTEIDMYSQRYRQR